MSESLSLAAAIGLMILAAYGLLLLLIVLVQSGNRRLARIPRRPRPYPGCVACTAALADDCDDVTSHALELHQLAEHTGGTRW